MNTRQVLKNMDTIMTNSDGADLKIEESTIRVWIEADEHTITIEILNCDEGRWEILDEYP